MVKNTRPAPQGNWLLVLAVVLLSTLPLLVVESQFEGTDDQGTEAITALRPDYEPWFNPVLEPASEAIESLLFAAQAAIGGGVVGLVIGIYRGRSLAQSEHRPASPSIDPIDAD
jgi:cobalt/nickel transport protein